MKINFEKLFNEDNIEKVNNEMQEYLPELFAQELSIRNTNELLEIQDKIEELNSSYILDLFNQYSNVKYEDLTFQNWLAYCIGFCKGFNYKMNSKK